MEILALLGFGLALGLILGLVIAGGAWLFARAMGWVAGEEE